jgi:hypothetical protein
MKYTEEDLRKAFQAGTSYGTDLSENGLYCTEDDENDYINSLKKTVIEEDKVSFTYSFLRRKASWEEFCVLTGIDYYAKTNGWEVKDDELFYITESKAKEYNLI